MRSRILRLVLVALIPVLVAVAVSQGTSRGTDDAQAHHREVNSKEKRERLRPGCRRHYRVKRFNAYTKARYTRRSAPLTKGQKQHIRHLAFCLANKKKTREAFKRRAVWRKKFRARLYHQRARLCGTPTCNGRLVYWMAARRWNPTEGSCLKSLAFRESGWDETADNPTSDAYGIPQALPDYKMSSHGSDWATNPATQIRWMMDYVAGRYGGACNANYYQARNNYY